MNLLGAVFLVTQLAQQTSTQDASFIIDLITNVGISGVCLFLYWDERKERRAAQALNNQLLERVLPTLTESTTTLERVQESQNALRAADTNELKRRLDELVTELRRGRGDR